MHIDRLISSLEETADPGFSADWDQSGIQIAGTKETIRTIAVTLDPSQAAIQSALKEKADFILTHHPLALSPRRPDQADEYSAVLRRVLSSGSWLYAAHTSLDTRTSGPVSWLARALGLKGILPIDPLAPLPGLKFTLRGFQADEALFQALGALQERPVFSFANEILDIVVPRQQHMQIRRILRQFAREAQAEVTETSLLKPDCGYGVVGELNPAVPADEFLGQLHKVLGKRQLISTGACPDLFATVAYCPGSGMTLARKAFALGADIFISGDLKFHQAQEIETLGLTLDVGHFTLEETMMAVWADELKSRLAQDIRVHFIPGRDPLSITRLTNSES